MCSLYKDKWMSDILLDEETYHSQKTDQWKAETFAASWQQLALRLNETLWSESSGNSEC